MNAAPLLSLALVFWSLTTPARADDCIVPGEAARWATEVCPKGDCPHPNFVTPCAEAKHWKAKWCAGYIKSGGQTTPSDCLEDRALFPAGVEEPVTERDVKLDGKACKQQISYHGPGKHKESRIFCADKREGVYESWAASGARYVQGGFAADVPAGAWSLFSAGNKLAMKMIYDGGHASERVPPLAPGPAGAYEVFLMTSGSEGGRGTLRIEADGKVTLAAPKTRAEAFLDAAAYADLQDALKKAWDQAAAALKGCDGKSAAGAAELTVALRHAGEVRRLVCVGRVPDELEAVRVFAARRVTAPGTASGDVLAIAGVPTDEAPGSLDFPRRTPKVK